jgi:N-acyl-D-aspartate/D-glutamate deacylase
MFDVVIRGGRVVDGTGSPSRVADVAVGGDRIVVIGDLPPDTDADLTIDATDRVVAPGFVDIHTHYDAQVFWDGALTPSPLHGVTTVIGGNCGFGITPLSDDAGDREYLLSMLARVEGIPIESLREGVPWDWRSTADYLDDVDGRLGINAGFMVGHSALRRAVMGPDATVREASTDEVDRMRALLRAGLDVGAFGFSSSWSRAHNDAEGHMVPSRFATHEELVALAGVLADHDGTSLEMNPQSGAIEPWTFPLISDMSVAARRHLNWNLLSVSADTLDQVEAQLAAGDYAAARGGRIVALTLPNGEGIFRLSFRSGAILDAMPNWEAVMLLPYEEKLAAFRDPEVRRRLGEDAQRHDNQMLHLADWGGLTVSDVVASQNAQYVGRTIGEIAAADGRADWDVLCDIVLADELNTGLARISRTLPIEDWHARSQVWRDDRVLIGGSDAGAHIDMLCTANYTTRLLAAARDHDLMTVEEAIHHVTQRPAALYGLRDRGQLREGWTADIVVIDPTTVGAVREEVRYDLPGGAGRVTSDAVGVDHVLVNGVPIVSQGALTEARPGRVLRAGQDSTGTDLG